MATRNGTSIPLFVASIPTIPTAFSTLLSTYSQIPSSSQPSHILTLRDRAYKQHPYPCLGRWRFLDLDLSVHPLYPELLDIFITDPKAVFLDLGCCIGQDIRKLISDLSANGDMKDLVASRIYGADLKPDFIDIGYELFLDEKTFLRSQFISPADVFDTSPSNNLSKLDGKVNIINCTAVFHLFGYDAQLKVADRCLRLLNRDGVGGKYGKKALILGAQTSNVTAGEYSRTSSAGMRWRHNSESWRKMWEDVVGREAWRDVVKGVEVGSELQERSFASKQRDGETSDGTEGGGERPKMIGKLEEGFRWQVWWVWVEFR